MTWTLSPTKQIAAVNGIRHNTTGTKDWADITDKAPALLLMARTTENLKQAQYPHKAVSLTGPNLSAIGIRSNNLFTKDWADMMNEEPAQFLANTTASSSSTSTSNSQEGPPRCLTPAQRLAKAREILLAKNPKLRPHFVHPYQLCPKPSKINQPVQQESKHENVISQITNSESSVYSSPPKRFSVHAQKQFIEDPNKGTTETALPCEHLKEPASGYNDVGARQSPANAKPSTHSTHVYDRGLPHPSGKSWEWIDEWGDPLNPEPLMETTPEKRQRSTEVRNDRPDWKWIPHLERWGPWELFDDFHKRLFADDEMYAGKMLDWGTEPERGQANDA